MHRHLLGAVLVLAGLLAASLLLTSHPAAAHTPTPSAMAAVSGVHLEITPLPSGGPAALATVAPAAATPRLPSDKAAPPPAQTPPPSPDAALSASGRLSPGFPNYLVYTTTGASLVPGTTDIGNHCDDCLTTLPLPFAYTLYDTSFTAAQVSSNGLLAFGTGDASAFNACLPASSATYALFPYWADLYTADAGGGQGIFTSLSGSAPTRIFTIEWRAVLCCSAGAPTLDFEVRLYEGQGRFDFVYGNLSGHTGAGATVGVQQFPSGPHFTQFSCNTAALAPGQQQIYLLPPGPACPTGDYAVSSSTGATVVPGTTRLDGPGCDDCIYPVSLPFAYTLYGQSFSTVNVSTNGNLQFASSSPAIPTLCLPTPDFNFAILPHWADLTTVNNPACPGGLCGLYTSISGSAPARIFNIEWRAIDLASGSGYVNFEVRLYEGTTYFEVVYGPGTGTGSSATVGVQHATGDHFTQVGCNTSAVATGLRLSFSLVCPPPPPTPTSTPTITLTPTITPTPLPLPCGTNVVANAGFENGGFAPWAVDNSAPAPFIAANASGDPVHSGSASAHVGFLPRTDTGGDSSFYQTITVPTSGGTLAYWYWPRSSDSLTYDWQDAYVQTASGVTLATIMHVCSNAQTWTQVSFDMAPYAGQTVRLKFLAHGDGAGDATDMFVDDIQLLTPACPTATATATGTPTSTATSTPTATRTSTPTATPTCAPAGQYRILIVHGDPSLPPTTLRQELLAQPGVSAVDLFDATRGTPTLPLLQQYQILVPYLDYPPADAVALGNVLADYIDGGGVVVASSLWSNPGPIAGRYVSGGYSPFSIPASSFTNNRVLGAYTAAHPLMVGVTSLTTAWGTNASPAPGAVLVASWSNGQPLLATQTVNGHTSIGFTAYLGDYATHFGDWARLIVNAGRWLAPPPCAPTATSTPTTGTPTATPTCAPAGNYRILLVHGDPSMPPNTLRAELLAQPGVSGVDLFDDTSGTPTLALLQQYQIVVPYVNSLPADAVALGNVLADYIDSGGVVVASSMWAPPWPIAGRYVSGGYSPYFIPASTFSANHALGAFSASHPLMAGVSTLVAPLGNLASLAVGATLVAAWTDGAPLLATQTVNGHTSVGLTAYLGDNSWHVGDFARVIVNAGRWLAPPPCVSTATATTTPTGTATSTATATATPTDTPAATHTPSSTPTETPTASPTPSLSPTATPRATNTPFTTATPTPTVMTTATATATATATPVTGGAYAYLQPGGPITVSVGSTVTLDLLVQSAGYLAQAQQSYLSFPPDLLQNVALGSAGTLTNTVAPDLSTFDSVGQNQVCNGPGACTFGALTVPAGSLAFASAAVNNPPASGAFRVARVTFRATALGDATLHWQFNPPDPVTRDSRITDANNQPISDRTLYADYTIHVVHPQIVGHVTWQGRPAQPDTLQALPITLTLTLNGINYEFPGLTTDASGSFTATADTLPAGTYAWRVKGPQYLATAGTVNVGNAPRIPIEMGLQLAGDANNDNLVDILDFGVLHSTFGRTCGDPGFDARADFTGDCLVDILDFALLRANFGQVGNRPVQPVAPKSTLPPGSAGLELRPQGNGPANGAVIHVGDRFTLELWVNPTAGTGVVAQQSYLRFPADKLQLGAAPGSGTTAANAGGITPDGQVLEVTLQNAICNGPRACAFGGAPTAAGSLAFASATLRPPAGTGPFRVGSVTVQAIAPGPARFHWLGNPPGQASSNTRIVTQPASRVVQPEPLVDYVLQILPAGK